MNKTKIIAMYLPQFHCIPENDKFWGKGFTDWVTAKNAKPLFKGHNQPRVPLNNNYYDLSQEENVLWQAKLAKKYGVYGFGVYHYWFNNEQNLLTKPAEIIRDSNDVDINYFLAWDNGNWKRSWSKLQGNDWSPLHETTGKKEGPEILIPYILGQERDWEIHFNYLLSHFRSKRYIKIDNKPVFVIYNYSKDIDKMSKYWDNLAKNNGFSGVYIIYRKDKRWNIPTSYNQYNYEPLASGWPNPPFVLERAIRKFFREWFHKEWILKYDYDKVWSAILKRATVESGSNTIAGAFVAYDDSPRRANRGKMIVGETPQKFQKYLEQLIKINESQKKEYIFLTAWNEWGEGAYLEPDEWHGLAYLDALKQSLINTRNFSDDQ